MLSFSATLPSKLVYCLTPDTLHVNVLPTSLSTSGQSIVALAYPRLPRSSTISFSMLSPESWDPPHPASAPTATRQAAPVDSRRVFTRATLPGLDSPRVRPSRVRAHAPGAADRPWGLAAGDGRAPRARRARPGRAVAAGRRPAQHGPSRGG